MTTNTNEAIEVPDDDLSPSEQGMVDYVQILQEKILFGLSVYPALSPSMLHVFLGTATAVQVWKPILNDLIAEGKVVRREESLTSSYGRAQTYTILHLATNTYTPPHSA